MKAGAILYRAKGKRRTIRLDKLCHSIKDQLLNQDKDFPVAVVGAEGEGKSTFAEIMSENVDDNYSVERNTFFAPTAEQANKFFLNEAKGSAPIFDEFGDVGYKLDFASSINKFLKKLFMKNRQSNMCPILCIPNFLDIDRYYRWRIKALIFIYKRGKFVMFKPLKYNMLSGDNWQINRNLKIWELMSKGMAINTDRKFLKTVRKWSIYYGEGVFPKMGARNEKVYKTLKTEYYQSCNEDTDFESMKIKESKKSILLKQFLSAFRNLGVMNKAVAELVGFNPDTTSRLARFEPDPVFTSRFNSIILSIDTSKLTNGKNLTIYNKSKELSAEVKQAIEDKKKSLEDEL